jgi:hypothetical protein
MLPVEIENQESWWRRFNLVPAQLRHTPAHSSARTGGKQWTTRTGSPWQQEPHVLGGAEQQTYARCDEQKVGEHSTRVMKPTRYSLPKSRLKKVLTLVPKEVAPSLVFSQAVFAGGSAALPASLNFSPVSLAPSTTVLPIPLTVSSTPRGPA